MLCFKILSEIVFLAKSFLPEYPASCTKQALSNHGLLYLHCLTLHVLKKKIEGQIFKRSFA